MEANSDLAPSEKDVEKLLQVLTLTDGPGLDSGADSGPDSGVDCGVNTDSDWEDQVRTVMETRSRLSEDLDALKLKQQKNALDFNKRTRDLEKSKEQAVRQHQALLEKLESVRVKLQLNNSKNTRKNFLSKKQEMTLARSHAQEERDRLSRELAEAEARLQTLGEEHREEQRSWGQDLQELRDQMKKLQREAQEAQSQAQREELRAVTKQRDTALERIEAWTTQVGLYLSGLRVELPHRYRAERGQWERKEAAVRKTQNEINTRFNQVLQHLQDGKDMETLPRITVPTLPHVPMSELYFGRMMQMTPRSQAPPPPLNPISRPRPPPPLPPPRHLPPPFVHHVGYPRFQPPPAQTPSPPPLSQTPPPSHAQAPPPHAQAPPPAVDKLDKLLEKLGSHFPGCGRAQLTSLLQQVKSDRGTLAGLSMEDLVEQVGQRLGQQQQRAGANTRPPVAPNAPRPKPCLVCQRQVEPGAQFKLSCSHTVHTECIQVWLQSSHTQACPFCPNK